MANGIPNNLKDFKNEIFAMHSTVQLIARLKGRVQCFSIQVVINTFFS